MPFPVMAAMALGGALGGLGGKQKAKAANQPTVTNYTRRLTPPSQLGGWDRLNEVMNRVRDLPMYRPGQNNPYLGATFGHIMGRAGVPTPAGGWMMPTPGGGPAMPGQAGGPPPPGMGDAGGPGPMMQDNPYLRSMRSY